MIKSRLSSVATAPAGTKSNECPFCTELLRPDLLHICPAGCCYVAGLEGEQVLVCPYCGEDLHPSAGHVCLELIARTEPVQ